MAKKGRKSGEKTIERHLANDGGAKTLIERAKSLAVMRKTVENRVLNGKIMEHLRDASGISQAAISRDLGVSITAYRQWESDQSIPSMAKYRMLQDYFCVYSEDDVAAVLSEIDNVSVSPEDMAELEALMEEMTPTGEGEE